MAGGVHGVWGGGGGGFNIPSGKRRTVKGSPSAQMRPGCGTFPVSLRSDTMESRQPRTEIVGFTLQGPEPLGTVHLRWSDGLTVLYGINGSGKTTVLRGVNDALSGRHRWLAGRNDWKKIVYVRLVDWDVPIDGPRRESGYGLDTNWFPHIEDDVARSLLSAAYEGRHDKSQRDYPTALSLFEEHGRDIRSGDYLALVSGRGDDPWWEVYDARSPSSGDVDRDRIVARNAQYAYVFNEIERYLGYETENVDVNEVPIEGIVASAPVALAEVDIDLTRSALSDALAEDEYEFNRDPFWDSLDRSIGRMVFEDPLVGDIVTAPPWVPHARSWEMFRAPINGFPTPITTGPESDRQREAINEMVVGFSDDSPAKSIDRVRDDMDRWRDDANRLRNELFPLLPSLDWRVNGTAAWLEGHPIEWVAEEPTGDTWIPFEQLSDAQRRAYNLVLDLAQAEPNSVLLIDEPETALHRKAVGLLAERLNTFTKANGFPVIAATHSAEFLALEDAQLVHVARQFPSGKAKLVEVERQQLGEHAEQLDLTVSEMLQLVRTFIVVEGEHDRLVIDGFIGDELQALGAEIVAMRGASKVVTLADAEVIFRYTDATVLVVLDAIDDPPALAEMWTEVTRLARRGESSLAHGRIQQYRQDHRDPNYEERQILALAQQILDRGDPSRVRFFGFTAKDIIEYLDSEAFGLAENWDSLRVEYDAYRLKKGDFKSWLHLSKGAQINQSTIKEAVEGVQWTERHNEFTDLLNRAGI